MVVVVILVWSMSQCFSKRNVETQKILGQVGELIIARGRLEILNIVEVFQLSCDSECGWRGEFWYARQGWHVSVKGCWVSRDFEAGGCTERRENYRRNMTY